MEVPLMTLVAVGEPVQVDKMDKPGAKTAEVLDEDSRNYFRGTHHQRKGPSWRSRHAHRQW